jgi:hypothetical protein
MGIHRDYYGKNPWLGLNETTPYDMTQGLAGGPWGSPNRVQPGVNEKSMEKG